MSWKRKILAVVFPPFAVVDKGCGIYLSAFILTCLGWIPGVIYAFAYFKWEQRKQRDNSHQVSKLQNNRSASKSNNASYGTSQQSSPFDRPRRMGNGQQNNNNSSQSWQGW